MICTVRDEERWDKLDQHHQEYCGALVNIMKFRNGARPHPIHGMLEVEPWPQTSSNPLTTINGLRFYEISKVVRSAHLIPAFTPPERITYFYVNNLVDWDSYNTLYDEDFITQGLEMAKRYEQ